MSIESEYNSANKQETFDLKYSVEERELGKTLYLFNDVVVIIDTSGKNYKRLPEVSFATAQGGNKKYSMERNPGGSNEVTMTRVSECFRKIANDLGYTELWFYPFGKDGYKKETAERARIKLYSQFGNIEPEETGYGYILKF